MNVAEVVQPGQMWESRDSRDLGDGPLDDSGRATPRRVMVLGVSEGRVRVYNVVTGRRSRIRLDVFASQRRRGGYRKVSDGAPYEYKIISPTSEDAIMLSRTMIRAGWRLLRRAPMMTDVWEDVTRG